MVHLVENYSFNIQAKLISQDYSIVNSGILLLELINLTPFDRFSLGLIVVCDYECTNLITHILKKNDC